MNAQLVIHKPVTLIGEALSDFFFKFDPDLYVEITNMHYLCREIEHNLQLVVYYSNINN